MSKISIELEGQAYSDGMATADKFVSMMTEKLDRIEQMIEEDSIAIERIAEAIESLQKAKDTLDE
jgi:hypothetical protein